MEELQNCKKCGKVLEKRPTKRTAEQLKKPYYFTHYYYCTNCQKLYHSEKFKVLNPRSIPLELDGTENVPVSYDVEIWTDGACVYNGTPRARAAWAFVSGKVEKAGLVEGKQTNNVAEGMAILKALEWAAAEGHKKIKLYSDSQISLNNLLKHPDKVKENAQIFYDIADVITKNGLTVHYEKVLGHSGDENNERVDKLANNLARNNPILL
jgi:ribonuclease HI